MMFHKHNYEMIIATKPKGATINGDNLTYREQIGVKIFCTICGKEKKRLSKKFCFYLAKARYREIKGAIESSVLSDFGKT